MPLERPIIPLSFLIISACRHPGLYSLEGTYDGVTSFIDGYIAGLGASLHNSGNEDLARTNVEQMAVFQEWITQRLDVASNIHWAFAIRSRCQDSIEALSLLFEMFDEFCKSRGGRDIIEVYMESFATPDELLAIENEMRQGSA